MKVYMPEVANHAKLKSDSRSNARAARDSVKRSMLKAVSWRIVGTIDTFILSFIIISFLGPFFGLSLFEDSGHVAQTAGYIAIAEVVTKLVIYTIHEQIWTRVQWGIPATYGTMSESPESPKSAESPERPESIARSTAKTATWRILASLDTMLLAWFFTGNVLTAISIGGFEVITKLFLYFFHERVWLKIPFGIDKRP